MRCGNMFSVSSVCLSVCLSVGLMLQLLKALTSQAYFWYAGTSSEYLGQVCISRSSGQGQGHRSKKRVCVRRGSTIGQGQLSPKLRLCPRPQYFGCSSKYAPSFLQLCILWNRTLKWVRQNTSEPPDPSSAGHSSPLPTPRRIRRLYFGRSIAPPHPNIFL